MFERLAERWAARTRSRFRAFVESRDVYEAYIARTHRPFEAMSEEDYQLARQNQDLSAAVQGFTTAVELSEQEGAVVDAASARYQLGLLHHARGELDQAKDQFTEALAVVGDLSQRDHEACASYCRQHLAIIELKQGRVADAVRRLRHCRRIDEALSNLAGVATCDRLLADCIARGANLGLELGQEVESASERSHQWDAPETAREAPTASEPEPQSGPVRYDRRELIWLASYSTEANDSLMEHLDSLGDAFGRPVSVGRAAFGAGDPGRHKLTLPESDQHLCAAILVLERAGLDHPLFQRLADECIDRVLADPGFRLLTYLHDLTIADLRELAGNGNGLVQRLFDTTQIAESPSPDQLRRALVPFVRRVERIEAEARWKKVRLQAAVRCSQAATALLLAVAGLALLGYASWIGAGVGWLPGGPVLASLVLGVLAFPVQAPMIFLLLRGLRTTALAPRDNVVLVRWSLVGILVMLGANHLQQSLKGPTSWFVLGIVAGVLLDVIRRAGILARRQLVSVDSLLGRAEDPALRDPRTTVLRGDPLNPYSCPILPTPAARVFISYTRSSDQASRLASSVFHGLREAGAAPFLDRASIPVGASWRRSLDQHLGECDAFVCILEEKAVQRDWVAAELLAALEARALTGTPDIFILLDGTVAGASPGIKPLFGGVVAASAEPPVPGRPHILPLSPRTRDTLLWVLSPERFTPMSILPRRAAGLVWLSLMVAGAAGGLGILTGPFLGFLVMLERMAGLPFSAWIAERNLVTPTLLLSAYWLGCAARTALAQQSSETAKDEYGAAVPTIAAIGLIGSVSVFAPLVSGFLLAWSGVLLVSGWLMVALAVRTRTRASAT